MSRQNQPLWLQVQFVAVTLVIAAVVGALGYSFYSHEAGQSTRRYYDELMAIATMKVEQIANWQESRISDGTVFYGDRSFATLVRAAMRVPDAPHPRNLLMSTLSQVLRARDYKKISLVDLAGKEILHVSAQDTASRANEVPLFMKLLGSKKIEFSDLHQDDTLAGYHIEMVVPLFGELPDDSTVSGYLLFQIDPASSLFPLVERWPIPSRSAETILLQRAGDDVFYLNGLRHRGGAARPVRFSARDSSSPAVLGLSGVQGVVEGVDYRGVRVLAAILPIEHTSWILEAKIDEDEITEPLRQEAWFVLVVAGAILIAAISTVGAFWNRRQVRLLKNQAMAADLLRKSEAKFRGLYENLRDAFVSTDTDGSILEFNAEFALMLGYQAEELRRLTTWDITPSRWHDLERTLIMPQVIARGYSDIYEKEYTKKDGTVVPVELRKVLVSDDQNNPLGTWGLVRNISLRKRELELLSESEERYRTLAESAPDSIFIIDEHAVVQYVNSAAAKLLGKPAQEIVGRRHFEFFPAPTNASHESGLQAVFDTGSPRIAETFTPTPHGNIWLETILVPIRSEGGRVKGLLGIARDVTDRKRLSESLLKLRKAVESSGEAIFMTDKEGIFTYVNPAFTKLYGYTSAEVVGKVTPRVLKSGRVDPQRYVRMWKKLLGGMESRSEFSNKTKLGHIIHVEGSASPIFDEEGRVMGFLGIQRDITERRVIQLRVEASRDQLRKLASRLESIREEERARIAREIHDELGQDLTAVKMNISWLTKKVENNKPVQTKLLHVRDLVDVAIKAVRRIATQLRPAVLDELGLEAAIEWQLQEFSTHSRIKNSLSLDPKLGSLTEVVSTAMFRILQEALTNVARHSGASLVRVSLKKIEGFLSLEIADDGCGIQSLQMRDPKSIGLLGMKERALALGGDVTIIGGEGGGTTVKAMIPSETI